MNALWHQIADDLGLARQCEAHVHPHVIEERADLFHTADGGSTEFEFLNLLQALVLATKPLLILETGTFHGFGTVALASALKANGVGQLISVDAGECRSARELVQRYELDAWVKLVQSESIKFCAGWQGQPFEFMFFDSDVSVRHREFDMLFQRKKVSADGLAIFHDASTLRHGVAYSWEMDQYLRTFSKGLTLGLSRGLKIIKV